MPVPVTISVALSLTQRVLLAIAGAGGRTHLQVHQPLRGKADHLTQQVRVRGLLHERAQAHQQSTNQGGNDATNHRAHVFITFQALDNVDRNEVVGLLGDNGAGKSTLVKIMSGVVTPDHGEFFRNGERVAIRSRKDSERLGIETIYQDAALVPSMSVMRNIFLGREMSVWPGTLRLKSMRATAMDVLEHTIRIAGITSPDLLVEKLSRGQQQSVAIARAVHFKTEMLLLDEPTSMLSVIETGKVLAFVSELRKDGMSGVFISHNLSHAYSVCDRFVIMSHGSVVRDVPKGETSVEDLTDTIVTH